MDLGNTAKDKNDPGMHLNFSTPAGWAMFYFFASVAILGVLFFTV